MSYEFYKLLHIVSIIVFVSGIGLSLVANYSAKFNKILTGISSLLIFVAGMGLIARLGFPHGEPWPAWLHVKITIWALVAIGGPIMNKRVSKGKAAIFYGIILLVTCAAYTAINKPF